MDIFYILKPTTRRTITTVADAVQIIAECINGTAKHLARPLYKHEWTDLVQEGHVFVYEPHCSGINQWNDFLRWKTIQTPGDMIFATCVGATSEWTLEKVPIGLIKLSIYIVRRGVKHYMVSYQRSGNDAIKAFRN
jgi:hypothetical protein